MTEDEIRVLEYVEYGLGGPNSIVKRLRPTFRGLIERGLIEPVTYYTLSSVGQEVLEKARPAQQDTRE